MDSQIDLDEAYSIETKTERQVFKLPEGPKKLAFFSKVGNSRLLRICQDNNLDEEILFTGWVGPSDSFVREQVSDHVQHYLFKRARRLSIDKKLNQIVQKEYVLNKEKKFQEHENYVKRKNEISDKSRARQEINRIRNLLISGEVTTAPNGFQRISKDPIYKLTRLLESVKDLEKADIQLKSSPFDLRNLNSIKDVQNKHIHILKPVSPKNCIEDKIPHNRTPKSSLSDVESGSSGFEEITLSPVKDTDIDATQSPYSNRGFTGDFISEHDLVQSHHSNVVSSCSVLEDSDEELSCAEEHSVFEEITGELEIDSSVMLNKAELSEPIEVILNQHTCNDLYKTGSDVVNMYLRQQMAGTEFMEGFISQFFRKQQTT